MPLEMEMPWDHGHNRSPKVAPQVQDVVRATLEPVGSVPRKGHLSCFDSNAEQRLYAHTVRDKLRQREIQMENPNSLMLWIPSSPPPFPKKSHVLRAWSLLVIRFWGVLETSDCRA